MTEASPTGLQPSNYLSLGRARGPAGELVSSSCAGGAEGVLKIPMLEDQPPQHRWLHNQRFSLSEIGRAAEASYRSEIVASRARGGRESYEAARAGWAISHGLKSDDGIFLGELTGNPRSLREIVAAVETSGQNGGDARLAMERLFDANLVVEVDRLGTS